MHGERRDTEDPSEKREPVEQHGEGSPELALLVERDTAENVPERDTEEQREQRARHREHHVPPVLPQRVVDLVAELDAEAAEEQQPQHEHQREIETAEARRVQGGKGGHHRPADAEEPHFVAVPHRPDRIDQPRPFVAVPPEPQVNRPQAEIEAVEDGVSGQHERQEDKPGVVEAHRGPSFTMRAKRNR